MKYKKDDVVELNDQRTARVLDMKEGNEADMPPRYYVIYDEGGGRGWWPENLIVGLAKKVEPETAKTPASQQAPSPANKRSFGE